MGKNKVTSCHSNSRLTAESDYHVLIDRTDARTGPDLCSWCSVTYKTAKTNQNSKDTWANPALTSATTTGPASRSSMKCYLDVNRSTEASVCAAYASTGHSTETRKGEIYSHKHVFWYSNLISYQRNSNLPLVTKWICKYAIILMREMLCPVSNRVN